MTVESYRVAAAHRAFIRRLVSSGPHRRKRAIWWTGTFGTRPWCESCGYLGSVLGPGDGGHAYHERHQRGCPYGRLASRVVEPTLGLVRSCGEALAGFLAENAIAARIRSEQGLRGGRWHLHGLVLPANHSQHIRADRSLAVHARDYGFQYQRRLRGVQAELAYLEKHETRLAGSRRSEFWPTWLATTSRQVIRDV